MYLKTANMEEAGFALCGQEASSETLYITLYFFSASLYTTQQHTATQLYTLLTFNIHFSHLSCNKVAKKQASCNWWDTFTLSTMQPDQQHNNTTHLQTF